MQLRFQSPCQLSETGTTLPIFEKFGNQLVLKEIKVFSKGFFR